jgi:hypothetical protein
MLAGFHHQWTVGGKHTLAIAQGMLNQRRCAEIGMDRRRSRNALAIKRVGKHTGQIDLRDR